MLVLTLLALLVSGVAAQDRPKPADAPKPSDAPKPDDPPKCAPRHIIVARGSFEPRGEGVSANLTLAIKTALPSTTSEALEYPARMPYNDSLANGTATLKTVITRHTTECPDSRIVLVGYNQGGAVALDALCGGGGHEEIGPATEGMSAEEGRNVKAVVVFGDPRYVPGMAYDVGTNNKTAGVSF